MPAQLVKLRTKADRLKTDQAEQLRQLVLDFPDLPQRAVGELIATIDRQTASRSGWTFVMISPEQNAAVVDWLRDDTAPAPERNRIAEAVRLTARTVAVIMRRQNTVLAASRQQGATA